MLYLCVQGFGDVAYSAILHVQTVGLLTSTAAIIVDFANLFFGLDVDDDVHDCILWLVEAFCFLLC